MKRYERILAALREVDDRRRALDVRRVRLERCLLSCGQQRFSRREHTCPKCGKNGSVVLDFLTRTRRCQWCQWQWWMDSSVCRHCLGTRVIRPPGETLALECPGCKGVVLRAKGE